MWISSVVVRALDWLAVAHSYVCDGTAIKQQFISLISLQCFSLQCFDTVGLATGRASGL